VAAGEVADVGFGQFVMGEIECRQAAGVELGDDVFTLAAVVDLQPAEEHRFAFVGVAVVEFGDVDGAEVAAEGLEAAGALGDGDGENGLALLAQFGALGHVAQPVEVHVGAAGDGDEASSLSRRCAGRIP
jgi:hypothetical protein